MRFFQELKRRKVLHTASLYVVAAWIALQVVEVLSDAGLPPATMRHVLTGLSIGFPFMLIAAWFYDISIEGFRRTAPLAAGEQLPKLNLGDRALVAGLVIVVALNVYVLSSPPIEDTMPGAVIEQRTLAVLAFEDIELGADDDPIGDVLAGELRSELTRTAGLRVLGPETSRAIQLAGERQNDIASELNVTSILTGDISLKDGELQLNARLIGLPAGNTIWQAVFQNAVGDAVELQKSVALAVLNVIIPTASAEPLLGSRIEVGECRDVYDLYLRGKQLRHTPGQDRGPHEQGMKLLQEAVRIDDQCAVAWEAIAVGYIDWSMPGFAKAGAAARRALELNDTLAEAWSVLAEIAENEKRWDDSEKFFLRAIYSDPTNAHVNAYYSEALVARGRVSDALAYALEAYRYEPASRSVNWHTFFAAQYSGDANAAIKHAKIFTELSTKAFAKGWNELAEAYLLKGDEARALSMFEAHGDVVADWYPRCIRARGDESQFAALSSEMRKTILDEREGRLTHKQSFYQPWHVIRCAIWINDADLIFDMQDYHPDAPTETKFILFFLPEAGKLRQDPRFRQMIVDSGLLDYWKEWGWSDYCRADGESFQCD
jgi:TolB-like protein